jgi:hypothetical protein
MITFFYSALAPKENIQQRRQSKKSMRLLKLPAHGFSRSSFNVADFFPLQNLTLIVQREGRGVKGGLADQTPVLRFMSRTTEYIFS